MADLDTATRLTRVDGTDPDGVVVLTGTLDPQWCIGTKPHGGYLLALMGRAAVTVVGEPFPHVTAAGVQFLRSPDVGPVRLEVEVLRSGRSAAQVQVRLRTGAGTVAVALLTLGRLEPSATPWWQDPALTVTGWDLPAEEDCLLLDGPGPGGMEMPFRDVVEQRLDPRGLGFARGRPGGTGAVQGYLRLSHDQDGAADPLALLMLADALPPATFDLGLTGWVPTIEYTVYARALPAAGPFRVRQRALTVAADRVDEVCEVVDSTGAVVAVGHQLAGVRLPDAAYDAAGT